MAYNTHLADRIRTIIGHQSGVAEKAMFGGLAWLVHGNMSVAASGKGGILVHVSPTQSAQVVAQTDAQYMEMRGRQMAGWLRVAVDASTSDEELAR